MVLTAGHGSVFAEFAAATHGVDVVTIPSHLTNKHSLYNLFSSTFKTNHLKLIPWIVKDGSY